MIPSRRRWIEVFLRFLLTYTSLEVTSEAICFIQRSTEIYFEDQADKQAVNVDLLIAY